MAGHGRRGGSPKSHFSSSSAVSKNGRNKKCAWDRMSLSILIILALVCGREGSELQDNADDEISNAAEREKNNTKNQRHEHIRTPFMRFAIKKHKAYLTLNC